MTKPPDAEVSWSALLPRLARFLPPAQFDRLRALPTDLARADSSQAGPELRAAVQALEPLYRTLVNYAPRYLLELDPTPGQPHGELIEGSFIFGDVTGFTALTELLARHGERRGLETMARIINDLFTAVLDPLLASGGDLLIFAGDAALAYFPQQADGSDMLQAVRTALRIQRAITPFARLETEFGRSSLTMSIGLERGAAYAGVVGTPQRMELLVSGPAIAAATRAEQQAAAGEVHLGPQALALARGQFNLAGTRLVDDLGEALGDYEIAPPRRKSGRSVIVGLDLAELLQGLAAALARVEQLAPFLPEDMLARLVNPERQRRLQAEFRPVASQFINISGLETLALTHGPELATQAWQRYFVRGQEIIRRHQGIVSQVDAYGDSFILLNTFGVPTAHEGTRRNAVAAALELAQLLDQVNRDLNLDPPLRQRAGLTFDLTFNGEIGAGYRRETVIGGPAVNRAARLMSQAGPGQIILDADIWARVRSAFVGEELPAVRLKGIDGPVVIINVRQARLGTRLAPPDRPPVGREVEQIQLIEALEQLQSHHQGSAWLVHGDTGLGKTTLVAELARQAKDRGLTALVGCGQPHGRHAPLFLWLDLLSGWLDVDEQAAPAQRRSRLQAELEGLEMAAAEQALANLLGLPRDDLSARLSPAPYPASKNPLLLSLDQKLKGAAGPALTGRLYERLAQAEAVRPAGQSVWQQLQERVSGPAVIGKLVRKLAARRPLVIILEDLHWADDDSLALLDELLAADLPLLLVATACQAGGAKQLRRLALQPLPETALAEVARRALGAAALDPALAGWLCRQAGGNPLFVEELCHELNHSDAVHIDRAGGQARWTHLAPALPLSLHHLLLARLDRLPLSQQAVLQRAAVFGLCFELEGVQRLCQNRLAATEVQAALAEAVQASFLSAPQGTTYRFEHPLLQDTIYSTLAFAQRQEWHTRIGDWLLEQHPGGDSLPLETIAYHYLNGADRGKAAHFGRLAGDRAKANEVYAGALAYYQQVLALPDAPDEERRPAAEHQADVLALQGDYEAAQTAYHRAVGLGSDSAAAKRAILAGDLAQLSQAEFSAAFQPWAAGARAWLTARAGEDQAALELVQHIEPTPAAARPVLAKLVDNIKAGNRPGEYRQWLHCFVEAVCR
ncbi:MAG: adenylate/guanylate cyclase domain-containing protein [Chloroflexota bacterium]